MLSEFSGAHFVYITTSQNVMQSTEQQPARLLVSQNQQKFSLTPPAGKGTAVKVSWLLRKI
jgi:hypothetical protein